jgi:hypothetical protein
VKTGIYAIFVISNISTAHALFSQKRNSMPTGVIKAPAVQWNWVIARERRRTLCG